MMNKIIAFLVLVLSYSPVHAAVDVMDDVWIVMEDIQSDQLLLRQMPFINCVGIPTLTLLEQFTREYKIPYVGCGKTPTMVNVNALECVKATISNYDEILGGGTDEIDRLTLDLSECKLDRKQKAFAVLAMIAAKETFDLRSREQIYIVEKNNRVIDVALDHKVVNLESNDKLSVRQNAGISNKIICELENNQELWVLSETDEKVGNSEWAMIASESVCQGWVNRRYLKSIKSN